ncbi:hypothetical protein DPSP01_008959 [Paraphaeosphaeria sporulosa]
MAWRPHAAFLWLLSRFTSTHSAFFASLQVHPPLIVPFTSRFHSPHVKLLFGIRLCGWCGCMQPAKITTWLFSALIVKLSVPQYYACDLSVIPWTSILGSLLNACQCIL